MSYKEYQFNFSADNELKSVEVRTTPPNIRDKVRALEPEIVKATLTLKEGDSIFIIIEGREIKEAKFFGETGCNDGSVWVVLPEHWNEDRESMCFCRQHHQWAANYQEAADRLRKLLEVQRRELLAQIEKIDSIVAGLSA